MTFAELAVNIGSGALAAAAITYVLYLVRTGGRDGEIDDDRVQRFVDAAPIDNLHNVLSKDR